MAKASKREKVVQVIQEEGFTLELTTNEASTLLWLMVRIGGNPDRTPRQHCNAIQDALLKVGAKELTWTADPKYPRIYFTDKE